MSSEKRNCVSHPLPDPNDINNIRVFDDKNAAN
jgi:hypothetical protein